MRSLFIYISLLFCVTNMFGKEVITLNTARTTGGTETACRVISLKPGFSFKATSTNSLLLKINPNVCENPSEIPTSGSYDQNYILTKTMLNSSGTASVEQISYYDGLGRPMQTVIKGASPSKKDIVTLQEYDSFGRESNSWQPASIGGTGEYVSPSTFKSASGSFYSDANAYSKPVYEPSPLNRVVEQYGPGTDWHNKGKAVKTEFLTNTRTSATTYGGVLSCINFEITSTGVKMKEYFPANQLYVTKISDEDGNESYEFKDKLGQVVLTRQMSGGRSHATYYVYDDFGNLRYVIPAMAADVFDSRSTLTENDVEAKQYAYIYKYDSRNRCVWKKLPGCDPIQMKYDKSDRLIFSQDGVQKTKGEWRFILYDVFGRETVNGISKSAPETADLVVRTNYSGSGVYGGYTVNLTLADFKLLAVNYFDNYNFVNTLTSAEKAKMPFTTVSGYDAQYTNTKGLLTGTRVYRLDDATRYSVSSLYYDNRGRVVQSHASNHLGGFDDDYFAYSFTGKVKQRQHVHSASGKSTQTEVYTYNYDHAERLLAVTHKLNSGTDITLATNTYDEVGRLKISRVHGETETLNYDYNVRNWLTRIIGSKFNQTLAYNTEVNGLKPTKESYSGNISATKWKAGTEAVERGYQFVYDGLSRLTSASYGEGSTLTDNSNRYNEQVSYDKMGNIATMQRQGKTDSGFGMIDNLTYNTYNGNQITKITDAVSSGPLYVGAFHFMDGANEAVEYVYDANGNLKKDYNKKIVDIGYNSLNLPSGLQFTNGNTTNYVYDASGRKLSVTHQTAVAGVTIPMTNVMTPLTSANILSTFNTDYCGNVVYENGVVSRILTENGYITLSGTTPTYHYYLKDHQGNNRVVLNQNGTVEQVNHYYPFGGSFAEGIQTEKQPYKYNGKELDRMHGLDMYDYSARNYDPIMGRFTTMDPMAEKYYSWSPYHYAANNPIRITDPTGMDWYEDEDGNAMWRRSQEEEYTDKNGKVWSNIGTEYLLFDGSQLHYLVQQEKDGEITGLTAFSYGAVSGRKQDDGTFSYSEKNQAQKNTGPIPDRVYSINPREIQNYKDLSIMQKAASLVGGGSFPGGTNSWGDSRVWINPSSVKVTDPDTGEEIVRTNMSIHGGSAPGSAGCIDLHKNASEFFKRLSSSKSSSIRLNVLYTPYNNSSQIWKKKK